MLVLNITHGRSMILILQRNWLAGEYNLLQQIIQTKSEMSNKLFSSVFTAILSAFFFSLAATTAPYFYGVGGGVFLLLSVRYISTFIFASILNKSPKKTKSKAAHTRLILISIFQAIFIASYMYSISLIPLSLAVVVIYTFPIITFFVNSILKSRSIDFLLSLIHIWRCRRRG